MSKGSRPRPYSVDQKTFSNNYDTIFKKKSTFKDLEEDADEHIRLAELENLKQKESNERTMG